jgi:hypothetical protein
MEPDNLNTNPNPAPESSTELTPGQKTALNWAILAFGFAVFFHIFNTSYMVRHAGFFAKAFSVIVATGMGTIGALIGDGIRKFAMPDAMLTSGMGETIKAKLFWKIGPQLIGLFLGIAFGAALVLG